MVLSIASLMVMMVSCSKDESLSSQSDELEDNYEIMMKGYSVTGPKVETGSTGMSEKTDGFFTKIQESLDDTYSKSDVSTRAVSSLGMKVGILKYSTCGNYPEFHYHQDNEDHNGATKITGSVTGATTVDSNENTNWKFCVVPGSNPAGEGDNAPLCLYGGGVLLLSDYGWSVGDGTVNVFKRDHDDEDSGNQNQITQLGGLVQQFGGYIGASRFFSNTEFSWLFAESSQSKNNSLGFAYGVIAWGTTSQYYNSKLSIDDEDSSNKNYSLHKRYINSPNPSNSYANQDYADIDISNHNTSYCIKYFF
jgi:hypothetical protein